MKSKDEEIQVLKEQIQAQQDMLERTTNYMEEIQEELRHSKAQVDEYSKRLEEMVRERTAQLEESNRQLRKALNEKEKYARGLQEANEELNDLMYRASHDLRAPITNSQGLLYYLQATGEADEDTLHQMEQTLNLLLGKVDQLHHLIYLKNLEEPQESVDVGSLIQELFRNSQSWFRNVSANLNLIMPASIQIETLQESFNALIKELIENAFQFANPAKGLQLTVRVHEYNGKVKMAFMDNGCGIAPEYQDQVFDMFFRGHQFSKTGLGLYMAKKLVQKLKGGIDFESQPEKGTSVHLSLPLIQRFDT